MDIIGLKAAADPTRARAAARDSMVCRMKVRSHRYICDEFGPAVVIIVQTLRAEPVLGSMLYVGFFTTIILRTAPCSHVALPFSRSRGPPPPLAR